MDACMSFHHPMLVHGAEPNTSGQRRGGLVYRYMPTTSHWDQEQGGRKGIQGIAYNPMRQLHLVRGIDICGMNNIYQPTV